MIPNSLYSSEWDQYHKELLSAQKHLEFVQSKRFEIYICEIQDGLTSWFKLFPESKIMIYPVKSFVLYQKQSILCISWCIDIALNQSQIGGNGLFGRIHQVQHALTQKHFPLAYPQAQHALKQINLIQGLSHYPFFLSHMDNGWGNEQLLLPLSVQEKIRIVLEQCNWKELYPSIFGSKAKELLLRKHIEQQLSDAA